MKTSSLISMDPPDIILVDRTCLKEEKSRIIEEFRNSTLYGHLPIVAVYSEKDIEDPAALEIPIDDFIVLGSSELQIRRRIEFIAGRSVREKDINPLTKLPGNESIIRCVQRMFDENSEIAIAWVDLDNFKPYNERYGFSSGDEVLLAAARIITNAVRGAGHENIFVGHIGGDDFLFSAPLQGSGRSARRSFPGSTRRSETSTTRRTWNREGSYPRPGMGRSESFPSSPFPLRW